jgi:hypothetical protein
MASIAVSHAEILGLDIRRADTQIQFLVNSGLSNWLGAKLQFQIQWERSADDPRELSEIPEVRLWFIRLDSRYPWLPLGLDWGSGELTRYAAMLIPHAFNRQSGIQYNPEALEIWVMAKVFVGVDWLQGQGSSDYAPVKFMAKTLGYELDQGLFDLL